MDTTKNKKRILIVDDQPMLRAFVQIGLKVYGFDVLCAGSGEEALMLAHSAAPDIMLLDILMPGMSGLDVLRELRAFTRIPVIAFSASPENREPAIRAGATQFVHKPFDTHDMALKIDALLN
jgi:DNA-binding response OmpR family regulator